MNKCYKIYISHVVRSIGLLIVIVVDNKQKILDNKKTFAYKFNIYLLSFTYKKF